MANPFLVLGGVAVGVITAGIGVLAVPGWIDSANDSAAINDLGSIRGAESAAILQIGEYTDDFGVLKSGELGVKFQKSDGVTLIGLKADTNESWCAATQSKSGKFFAASNIQAAIATGPGAESAMTTAGCDPDIITQIIDEAGNSVPPIDVGEPGGTGGSWVGGGDASGGNSGGDDGSEDGDDSSTGSPEAKAAYAIARSTGQVAAVSNGVYALSDSYSEITITHIDASGVAKRLEITGPLADHKNKLRQAQLKSNGADDLFIAVRIRGQNPIEEWAIFRINPDGSTEKVTENADPDHTDGLVLYAWDVLDNGNIVYSGNNYEWLNDWWWSSAGIWDLNTTTHEHTIRIRSDQNFDPTYANDLEVDSSGNIYLADSGGTYNFGVHRVTPDLVQTTIGREDADGMWFNPDQLLLAPDGTLYAGETTGELPTYRVNTDGSLTSVGKFGDDDWWNSAGSFAADGTLYYTDGWGQVVKLSAGARTLLTAAD